MRYQTGNVWANAAALEHRAEKWAPVFRKNDAKAPELRDANPMVLRGVAIGLPISLLLWGFILMLAFQA